MTKNTDPVLPSDFLTPSPEFDMGMQMMDMHWWFWNQVERQLTISPRLMKVLGYTEEDFDPSVPTLDRNIHPEDADRNLREFRKLLQGESDYYEMEYRVKVNGEWRWYYNRGAVVARDGAGQPLFVGGITMNMSGRFYRMISMIEEGGKFEFVFKHTAEPVFITDYTGRKDAGILLDMNEAAEKLLAMPLDEVIGKDISDVIDRILLDQKVDVFNELNEKGYVHFETNYSDRFGVEKYLEINAHTFTLTGKDLLIAIINDKSESFLAKKDLQSSENLYRKLIQSADDRIGLYDTERNPIILNSAYTQALGYTNEEYMELDEMELFHPDDREKIKERMSGFFEKGLETVDYRIRHRNGNYLHMSAKVMLLKGEEVGRDYVLYIIRDITEEREFQKELVDAKEKAEESDKLKSAFLANMSHEIRTPMNSIVGFSNLLTDPDLEQETREEYVSRINRNSDQLLALITDIIDLSKIESNQLMIAFCRIHLDRLLDDLLNYGKHQLKSRMKSNIELLPDPDPDHPELVLESDLMRLTQVMQNLLNNAIKFTREGKVTIGYRMQDDKVRLFVRDTGLGIDAHNFDIIFDQFRQIDGSHTRRFGGTGLGLAICRNLVELLGGRIWVESEKGKGSCFTVELPLSGDRELISVSHKDRKSGARPAKELRILMVEDDIDSRLLLTSMMEAEGIELITAESGYKALRMLESEKEPDMVFLDLQMPVLNGKHTMMIIKDLYPKIKVIAQSAHAIDGDRDKFIAMGFDDYFAKPYRKEEIMEVIQRNS